MKKNIIPLLMIFIVGTFGGVLFALDKPNDTDAELLAESEDLRELYLSVPGMFCAGCSSSVEAYVSSMDGVKRVSASLIDKTANVIYDPKSVRPDEIIDNDIFELYGVSLIDDQAFTGSFLPETTNKGELIPDVIIEKSQQVLRALNESSAPEESIASAQSLFNQVNSDIESSDFINAEALLDTILNILNQE